MVRRATSKTTCLATDNDATRELSGNTRGQHRIHAEQRRRREWPTHIQGLRDPEDAEEPRILARKRGRKYAK